MKLRNKKTGEIVEAESCNSYSGTIGLFFEKGRETDRAYETLAELNEEWEDYKPIEPLIKDKKVRKAVRAWAEAIGEKNNLVVSKNMEYHDCCIYCGDLGNPALIDLNIDLDIEENSYTLAELCGEEEE